MADKKEIKSSDTAAPLETKLKDWLSEQGYPTEFKVADICHRHGFRIFQGSHVKDEKTNVAREIDVEATVDYHLREDFLIRVEHLIECKWSKDKPWIVFTTPFKQMHPAACVAQTIGNVLGNAAIWALAGDSKLHATDFFQVPKRPGYGGRQAFSSGQDRFYSALAGVTELSLLTAADYSHPWHREKPLEKLPRSALLIFPIIVVEGHLFEAYFDQKTSELQMMPRDRVRIHWRGSREKNVVHATIDIVALDHLDAFMSVRAREVPTLLESLHRSVQEIAECFRQGTLAPLTVTKGPRGFLGAPPLLRDLLLKSQVQTT